VILNNQDGAQAPAEEAVQEADAGAPAEQGPLGQAAASDAFLINGTVGRGDENAGFGGGFQGPGGGFGGGFGDNGAGQNG
jgi:hypothetical protein